MRDWQPKYKHCECGGGMFIVTTATRSTGRVDYVGNIYGVSKWKHRELRVVCETCGKNQHQPDPPSVGETPHL